MITKGAILVYGGGKTQRAQKIQDLLEIKKLENTPDIKIIDLAEKENSIKLEQVREGIRFLSRKPFEKEYKVLVILNAEKMTDEAQNALLKILEEPPSYASILLSSKTENSLLDTVVSRCRKFHVAPQNFVAQQLNRMGATVGERLDWASELAKEEKDTIIEQLEILLTGEREKLLQGKSSPQNIKKIEQTIENIENTNASPRLALEVLVLNLK